MVRKSPKAPITNHLLSGGDPPSTLPKFNSSPLKNDAWKTSLSFWDGIFSGAFAVKLPGGYQSKGHTTGYISFDLSWGNLLQNRQLGSTAELTCFSGLKQGGQFQWDPFWRGSNNGKYMVNLKEFPYNSAWFGLVTKWLLLKDTKKTWCTSLCYSSAFSWRVSSMILSWQRLQLF